MKNTEKAKHIKFILEALKEASKGVSVCSPNPAVGAVAVVGDEIIAKDWHKGPGTDHAEVLVLNKIPRKTANVSLYVTLEPCNHWGRTPPCVDAIIKFGVQRVIYAFCDPNPIVKTNNSSSILNKNKIEVIHLPLPEINDFYKNYTNKIKDKTKFLNVVSLVGIDTKTKIKDLLSLYETYPFLEFGVCFDEDKDANISHCGYKLLNDIRESPSLPWVAHLSHGTFLKSLNDSAHLNAINWRRIQLNLSDRTISSQLSTNKLINNINLLRRNIGFSGNVILRENYRTREIYKKADLPLSIDLLSDVSCGNGISPSPKNDWPFAYYTNFGFAGGIGVDNVVDNIAKIRAKIPDLAGFNWIDMETSLRDKETGYFDLNKALEVARLTKPFIKDMK
ncbi:MAG: bifunctional diaminohydroxyphosphoribosylaminopyrimidine deaminase/5-amino-6-(5-phosphoribosylamino)uracil reductase RibD [Legionellaceae bacterium]|nr:bifunctional diaminohydroxyphosphoribosylaminopyrimidine deaminase/5-amino-6-(5-phosphoribosylamino)uracil reductase RibD [Legionellaceae bacterium]